MRWASCQVVTSSRSDAGAAAARRVLVLVAALGIDDVDRLFTAAHALDEERIDHGAFFLRAGHERAGVKVVAELGVGERA